MSANVPSFHLFGEFPSEIRLQIWEAAVFDFPSRVCGLDTNITASYSEGVFGWKDSSGLVVHDIPSMRYVCHESRQVALKHADTSGWTVSGKEPPYRHYDPRGDVLYINNPRNIEDVSDLRLLWHHGSSLPEPEEYEPMAAVRMRQARHIALSRALFELVHKDARCCFDNNYSISHSLVGDFLRDFPRLEKISVALSQIDVVDFVPVSKLWPPWQLPQRPCKLEPLARPEPPIAVLSNGTIENNADLEEPLRFIYRYIKRMCGTFVEAADLMPPIARTRRMPVPMIAMVYQLSQVTNAGYNWEKLPCESRSWGVHNLELQERH